MQKIAIIGGGATGLIAAVCLARAGKNVEIFEQNSKLGKKILISGNGHCNISNTNLSSQNYICKYPKFVKDVLDNFDFLTFKKFLYSISLLIFNKEDGRTYPLSYEAKSVMLAFESVLSNLDVKIFYNTRVSDVQKNNSFSITCNDIIYKDFSDVIISSGLQAMPRLGANEDGLVFAKKFGHTISPTYPALVALKLKSLLCEKLSGVKTHANVALFIDNQKRQTISGDILFTKYGISGLAILDISSFVSKKILNHQKVELSLNLFAQHSRQALSTILRDLCKNSVSILSAICGLVAYKIAIAILEIVKIQPELLASKISRKTINIIVNILIDWRFEITDTRGFQYAEASGGGVDLKEIQSQSLQSKKCNNLYFGGEVLDVLGKRGGYNFHFAFGCGYMIAKNIINKNI